MAEAPDPRRRARAKAKADKTDGNEFVVVVGGTRYPLRFDGLSPRDIRECRKECGMSPQGVVRALRSDPDLDLVAALMWLSRRQQGEDVTYDDVCDGLDYSVDLDFETAIKPGDEDPASPEA